MTELIYKVQKMKAKLCRRRLVTCSVIPLKEYLRKYFLKQRNGCTLVFYIVFDVVGCQLNFPFYFISMALSPPMRFPLTLIPDDNF